MRKHSPSEAFYNFAELSNPKTVFRTSSWPYKIIPCPRLAQLWRENRALLHQSIIWGWKAPSVSSKRLIYSYSININEEIVHPQNLNCSVTPEIFINQSRRSGKSIACKGWHFAVTISSPFVFSTIFDLQKQRNVEVGIQNGLLETVMTSIN